MPFFWQRPRPMHLGRFPMEKIKRVSETTSKITDNVPRMPKRAHFFQRARLGELGYEARAHTNADSEVLHNPLTMLAGLGELSSIGEVVLNLFLGPRFKTAVITTNLPMAVDQPIDFDPKIFVVNAGNAPVSVPPERYPSATR